MIAHRADIVKDSAARAAPFNEGDGIVVAAELGADLVNMHEVWWYPAFNVPGEEHAGRPYNQLCTAERASPHAILVAPAVTFGYIAGIHAAGEVTKE